MVGNRQSPIRSFSPKVGGGGSTITPATLTLGPWHDQVNNPTVRATPSLRRIAPDFPIPLRVAPSISRLQPHFTDAGDTVHVSPSLRIAPHLVGASARVSTAITRLAPHLQDAGDTVHVKPSTLSLLVQGLSASKDAWFGLPTASVCSDDANHNGDNLRVSIVNNRASICGWDMSPFGGTTGGSWAATSAVATFRTQNAQSLGTDTVQSASIALANEGWNETTVKCSTAPPVFSTDGSTALPSAAETDFNITLDSIVLARLTDALNNSTTFSLRLAMVTGSLDTERVLYDKENGGSAKAGRLTFTAKKVF